MEWSDLLGWIIPNPAECRAEAERLTAANPGMPPEDMARLAVKSAKKWAGAVGGAAGVVSNPLAMIPTTLAEAPVILRAEGKVAGVVAALLDPNSLDDYDAFQADILAVVFPGAVSQHLRPFGVRVGQVIAKDLIRKYIRGDVLRTIVKIAAKYLGLKLTQKALIARSVPLVGAGIGFTWNWIEVGKIGKRAIAYHSPATNPQDDTPPI